MQSSEEVLNILTDNLSLAGHISNAGGPSPYLNLRRLISTLTKKSRVVLLLDEFDALTQNDAFPVTFFNFLRSLANEFPVALVLTAARKLKDICHSDEVAGSPFFNIFHERRLGCFTESEARQLITGPSQLIGHSLAAFSDDILHHVGRWPLFLQIMCYWLIEAPPKLSSHAIDVSAAKARVADDVSPHLRHLWSQLLPLERNVLSEAARHGHPADAPQATVDALVARGLLAHVAGDRHQLAFELLATFVEGVGGKGQCAKPARGGLPIFVSYCHQDAAVVERWRIVTTLQDLEADGFAVFSDHQIKTGDSWNDLLVDKLKESRILVALVTQDYLRSRYCQDVEIKAFWDGRVKEGLVIFPIIMGPCEWDRHSWLATTQFFPRKGSVMDFKPTKRQALLIEVLKELRAVGERMRRDRASV